MANIHSTGAVALRRAVVVTLSFMVVEFVGGYMANSLALMSDAAHMLTDSMALMLGLFAFWIAARPSTPQMTFGYHRAEILGALTSGLLIWFLTAILVYEAILRIAEPPQVQGGMVMVIGSIGLGVNLVVAWILHGSRSHSLNLKAAYLHVLGDLLGSVGAIASGLTIWATGWNLIDPLVTFFIAALLLYGSWHIVVEAVGVLMESAPRGVDAREVRYNLERIPSVQEVHDLHIWSVSTGVIALSVHLVSSSPSRALREANRLLDEQYGIHHTTLQVEHPEEFQSDRCYECVVE
jgi:cobalt-zinc-cadmium efflux system protein